MSGRPPSRRCPCAAPSPTVPGAVYRPFPGVPAPVPTAPRVRAVQGGDPEPLSRYAARHHAVSSSSHSALEGVNPPMYDHSEADDCAEALRAALAEHGITLPSLRVDLPTFAARYPT